MEKAELSKLRELLAKEGIEEEKVESIVAELEGKNNDEENKGVKDDVKVSEKVDDEGNQPDEKDDPKSAVEAIDLDAKVDESTPAVDVVPEKVDDVVPPAVDENPELQPSPDDPGLPQGLDEVNPAQDNPEQQPAQTPVDYQIQIDEQAKVIEGLNAKVSSLEEALRKGGILTDEAAPVGDGVNPVGIDENQVPANKGDNPNGLEDFINQINRKNRY